MLRSSSGKVTRPGSARSFRKTARRYSPGSNPCFLAVSQSV